MVFQPGLEYGSTRVGLSQPHDDVALTLRQPCCIITAFQPLHHGIHVALPTNLCHGVAVLLGGHAGLENEE